MYSLQRATRLKGLNKNVLVSAVNKCMPTDTNQTKYLAFDSNWCQAFFSVVGHAIYSERINLSDAFRRTDLHLTRLPATSVVVSIELSLRVSNPLYMLIKTKLVLLGNKIG